MHRQTRIDGLSLLRDCLDGAWPLALSSALVTARDRGGRMRKKEFVGFVNGIRDSFLSLSLSLSLSLFLSLSLSLSFSFNYVSLLMFVSFSSIVAYLVSLRFFRFSSDFCRVTDEHPRSCSDDVVAMDPRCCCCCSDSFARLYNINKSFAPPWSWISCTKYVGADEETWKYILSVVRK